MYFRIKIREEEKKMRIKRLKIRSAVLPLPWRGPGPPVTNGYIRAGVRLGERAFEARSKNSLLCNFSSILMFMTATCNKIDNGFALAQLI